MLRKCVNVLVLLLAISLIVVTVPIGAQAAGSSSVILIREDVEEATYSEWASHWERYDANKDVVAGEDYWCRTTRQFHDGSHAAYCARIGYNSHYFKEGVQSWNTNITNLPANTSAKKMVYRYDTDQDSIMRKNLVGARYYGTVTVTFWYWSDTGYSDAKQPSTGTTVGYDFLNVICYTGSGENMAKQILWTDSYAQATAKSWIMATVDVPNDATMVGFEFVSGSQAPRGGDAADAFASSGVQVVGGGMKEGVYIDDITVSASDPLATIPVATAVDSLAMVQNNHYFPVNFTVNEPTVQFSYVNLYYRPGTDGPWTMYTSASNPDGKFYASPIMFLAGSDGTYRFFTQGFDIKGGAEVRKDSTDANTVVDTIAPLTDLMVKGTLTTSGAYSGTISLSFAATDASSGVEEIAYRIDGGPWTRFTGSAVNVSTVGGHVIEYRATDLAGNVETTRNGTITIKAGASDGTGAISLGSDTFPLLIGLAALVAVVAVALIARRRR